MPAVVMMFLSFGLLMLTLWAMRRLRRSHLLGLVAALTRRSLPLETSLTELARAGAGTDEGRMAASLALRLARGYPLHEALRAQGVLDAQQSMALKVAEERGATAAMLTQFAASITPNAERVLKYDALLIYPLLIGAPLLWTTAFLAVFIMPKYQQMFKEMEIIKSAPLDAGPYALLLVGVLFAWGLILFSFSLRPGKLFWWHIPILGTHIRMEVEGKLARHLGLALSAGATLEHAVQTLSSSPGNLRPALREISVALQRGVTPLQAFRDTGRWREEFLWALDAISGGAEPAAVFTQVAEVLEEKVQARMNALDRVGTPVGILVAAAGVGLLSWSVFATFGELAKGIIQ